VNQVMAGSVPVLWLLVLAGYLLGSIPFGYLLVRMQSGSDIRAMGSGNIGATNVARTAGWFIGAATLVLDGAKGFFAVWLAGHFSDGNIHDVCGTSRNFGPYFSYLA
jgi:glycerol-3-phosphate acyltransferase PlsY